MTQLPVAPKGKLAEVFTSISPKAGEVLVEHLLGGTSAERLASTLRDNGHDISATTLKEYRRTIGRSAS